MHSNHAASSDNPTPALPCKQGREPSLAQLRFDANQIHGEGYALRLIFATTMPASCMFQHMHRRATTFCKRDTSHADTIADMTIPPGLMHVNRALHISLTNIEILLISFDSNATYSADKP
jgi:hypothetical protein